MGSQFQNIITDTSFINLVLTNILTNPQINDQVPELSLIGGTMKIFCPPPILHKYSDGATPLPPFFPYAHAEVKFFQEKEEAGTPDSESRDREKLKKEIETEMRQLAQQEALAADRKKEMRQRLQQVIIA